MPESPLFMEYLVESGKVLAPKNNNKTGAHKLVPEPNSWNAF
jgi:hypothetical protein